MKIIRMIYIKENKTRNFLQLLVVKRTEIMINVHKDLLNRVVSVFSFRLVTLKIYSSASMVAIICLMSGLVFSCSSKVSIQSNKREKVSRPNILIITADDMTYNSLGVMGNPMENITPNIDQLAKQGMLFTRGYNTTPVCGPSRESILTGLYPEHHGQMGHGIQPPEWWKSPQPELTGLVKWLRQHGYYTGVIDKHVSRHDTDGLDYTKTTVATGLGRDPSRYYSLAEEFFKLAAQEGKPFVLNVNSADPHQPLAADRDEKAWTEFMLDYYKLDRAGLKMYPNGRPFPDPRKSYSHEEVVVPAPYPDILAFRELMTNYYGSVNRLDEVVGCTLEALGEERAKNTIVIFLSDHGLPFSFSKWSLYPHGTRTPIIVRWPERVRPGQLDATHLLSTVDIMPTILDAVNVPLPYELDGISFLPLMTGKNINWPRENVFTTWNFMDRGQRGDPVFSEYRPDIHLKTQEYRPMRALHGKRFVYIWNSWSDRKTKIPIVMGGEGSKVISMLSNLNSAGPLYPDPSKRVQFYLFRTPEELYDVESDPGCLKNLSDHPAYIPMIKHFRGEMLSTLEAHRDHELANYRSHLGAVASSKKVDEN